MHAICKSTCFTSLYLTVRAILILHFDLINENYQKDARSETTRADQNDLCFYICDVCVTRGQPHSYAVQTYV